MALERMMIREAAALLQREKDLNEAINQFLSGLSRTGRPWLMLSREDEGDIVVNVEVDGNLILKMLQEDLSKTQARLLELGVASPKVGGG